MSSLPKGWVEIKLGELIELKYGKALPAKVRDGIGFPVYGSNGIVGSHSEPLVYGGGLIIGRKGSFGEVHISNDNFSPIDTTYYVDTFPSGTKKYWYYQLKNLPLTKLNRSTAIPGLNRDDAYAQMISLPPDNEQKRIVEKLDEVLAQVDTIKARLDGIPSLLKRFRQSVLASAVSGKLTEEWRGEKQYDEEGYPSYWLRKGLDDLGALARGKSKHRPRNDPRLFGAEYPFIQTGEVAQSNGIITSCSKWYSEFGLEQGKLFSKGTLCITIAANIADTAILGIDACFPDSVVGFTPNKDITSALFVKYLIDVNKNRLEQFAPATAQKNINLKVLKSLSLPYPNLDEQKEIVRLVEQYFAFADTIEAQVKKAQARVNNLTQSILAKAFRGELVPQDPNDEPADKLLERIAQARIEAETLAKAAKKAETARKKAEKAIAKG
ncbi:restriction endonuclease subunit S [Aliivibrio finisterrensis]|uniref:Restriction endonuclease subunit S n=1 Tax=Aliivibrio finisterrensis TaxID=511998 RepID=A0A6N6RX05_9GAMM|nr:restriction endonuclease subunit S [Aliivibrio finisterrensis]KAB2825911.1 restriction endonuclease subunit S [Aliivibrio finisterrensis]